MPSLGKMNTVTIELKRGESGERLDYIGWKDNRRAFYARPHNGKPRVILLTPALPRGAIWTDEPFPECAPVKIVPCTLLPPLMRESESKGKTVIPFDDWEDVNGKTHGITLNLTSDDDKTLRERLAKYKKSARSDYRRYKNAAEEITDPAEQARTVEAIEREYNGPLHTFEGLECAGKLNMTLSMVKRGCEGIRDALLLEWWAKKQGVDLEAMRPNRAKFWEWIVTHAEVSKNIYDSSMKELYRSHVPLDFCGDRDPQFLAACAGIRFRIEFQNGAAAFLTECDSRTELRAEEWRELRELGFETPKERKETANRTRGVRQAAKSRYGPVIVSAAKNKYKELRQHHPKSKIETARQTVKYIKQKHGLAPEPETILNWVKGKTRSARKKTS